MKLRVVGGVAGLCVMVACRDARDQEAKARIFSPEAPPLAVAKASEKLDIKALAKSHPARLLGMDTDEAIERLGAHRTTSTLVTTWESSTAGRLQQTEKRVLEALGSAVTGDFHAALRIEQTSHSWDVMRLNGRILARSGNGPWRERKRDRGLSLKLRATARGALQELQALTRGRLVLSNPQDAVEEGRAVIRFQVSLGEKSESVAALPELKKALKEPKDDGNALRLQWRELAEPVKASGTLSIDERTAVPVAADISLRFSMPPPTQSTVTIKLSQDSGQYGSMKLDAPADFLPDTDKPAGIATVLERAGLRAKKGATAAAEFEDEAQE